MAKKENKTSILEFSLPERVDTFNQDETLSSIQDLMEKVSAEVVLNLSENRFLSLPFIKGLAALAGRFRNEEKSLVLLNATEKIKKQIGIFSDLEVFTVRRAALKREWPSLDANADF